MSKEIIEKLEKIEMELVKTKKQLLAELTVYNDKLNCNINTLIVQNQLFKTRIDKYFDYEKYFDKLIDSDKFDTISE